MWIVSCCEIACHSYILLTHWSTIQCSCNLMCLVPLLFLMDVSNNRNNNKINQQNQQRCHQTIRGIYSPVNGYIIYGWNCVRVYDWMFCCLAIVPIQFSTICIIRLPKKAKKKDGYFFVKGRCGIFEKKIDANKKNELNEKRNGIHFSSILATSCSHLCV